MTRPDQRWVPRVPCDIPARLHTRDDAIRTTVHDISRYGLRLGINPLPLDLSLSSSVGIIARRLAEVLPDEAFLELHHNRLGVLVSRYIRVVRVLPADMRLREIHLGCSFDHALTDDEVAALGIVLPEPGETMEEAWRRHSPQPPRPRRVEWHAPPDEQGEDFLKSFREPKTRS